MEKNYGLFDKANEKSCSNSKFDKRNRLLAIITIFIVFLYAGLKSIRHLSMEAMGSYTSDSSHIFEYLKREDAYLNKEELILELKKFADVVDKQSQRNQEILIKTMPLLVGWTKEKPDQINNK